MIHHNLEEFTMNFIYIFPNGAQGKLTGSMIVSPGHAKRIWRALGENIARYESQFGSIKESPEVVPPTVGFVRVKAQQREKEGRAALRATCPAMLEFVSPTSNGPVGLEPNGRMLFLTFCNPHT